MTPHEMIDGMFETPLGPRSDFEGWLQDPAPTMLVLTGGRLCGKTLLQAACEALGKPVATTNSRQEAKGLERLLRFDFGCASRVLYVSDSMCGQSDWPPVEALTEYLRNVMTGAKSEPTP